MPSLQEIVKDAMVDLQGLILQGAEARGKNATGQTGRSIQTSAIQSQNIVAGTLTMEAQWKWWGNGRGPGRMPPIDNIQRWIDARGLSLSAYAVAHNMAKKGSLDYRLKRTNIVEDEVTAWEAQRLTKLEEAVAENIMDRTIEIFKHGK